MEVAKIMDGKVQNNIYGLMGNIDLTTNNTNYSIITDYKFKGTVKEYLNSPKDISSLKMVMLNESLLTKTSSELSIGELKKISLAKALIENKEYLILNYFEKEQNYQEKENFKRLWKRLATEHKKTIVIFTNDITSFWDIAKELIVVDNFGVINTVAKDSYFQFMPNLNQPEIVRLTALIKAKGINIEEYKDVKDLLKAIYRFKEKEQWDI